MMVRAFLTFHRNILIIALSVYSTLCIHTAQSSSAFLTSERLKAADAFYQELIHGQNFSATPLERLERQVNAKRAMDEKNWWDARYIFQSVLKDNPKDFQSWYLMALIYIELQKIDPSYVSAEAMEAILVKAFQSATTDSDRGIVLWTAARVLNKHHSLQAEALKLTDQGKIESRIHELQEVYPSQFAPYFIDVPQRTDIGSVCVDWTYPLLKSRSFRYEDYISLQPAVKDLAVIARGKRICVEGLAFGETYKFTFKKGFKAERDVELTEDQNLDIYVPHRKPVIRFRERGYILPAYGPQVLPFIAVNVPKVQITLIRIPERNFQSIKQKWFANNIETWDTHQLKNSIGEVIWEGTYDCHGELNQTATTGIPIEEMLGKKLTPGIYIVQANIPGQNYQSDAFAAQALVVSDIGLAIFQGPDGLHVYARSLVSAQPLANIDLALISRNNRVLSSIKTQKDGYAVFPDKMINGKDGNAPVFLEASLNGEQFTLLNLRNEAFDLTDRGVQGRQSSGVVEGYIYSDRGIYRPGEKVVLMSLLRDKDSKAVTQVPLTLKIFRPDGVESQTSVLQDAGAGAYLTEFMTAANSPTGQWTAAIFLDPKEPEIGRTTFKIHDFVPPRIEVKAQAAASQVVPHQNNILEVKARYYFGPPGAHLKVEAESDLTRATHFLEKWKGYIFGLEEEQWVIQKFKHPATTTNGEGLAHVTATVDMQPQTSHLLQLETLLTVFETGGRPRTVKHVTPFWHQPYVIGLSPRFKERQAPSNGTAVFDIVALDQAGNLQVKEGLRYTLYEEQYDYVWFCTGYKWQYELVIRDRVVQTGILQTTAQKPSVLELPVAYGRYRLEVLDERLGVATSMRFAAGWQNDAEAPDRPDMLDIKLDQASYREGQKARVYIQTPFAGELQIAAAGQTFKPLYTGKIGKEGITLDIPVKGDLFTKSGGYLIATVYQPADMKANQMPARAIGVTWLDMKENTAQVNFKIEVPTVVKPAQAFEVALRVPKDRPQLRLAVAVVDEAILSLVDYLSPNPHNYFFAQTRLAYDLRDNYGYLINPYGTRPGSFEVGGDAMNSRALANLGARPFKIVSLFSGIIETRGQSEIRIPFKLPEFSGKLRVMAVAWDETAVGQSEASLTVREDIDLYMALPRFLAPGDEATVPILINNLNGPEGAYTLTVDSSEGTLEKKFALTKGQELQLPVELEVANEGTTHIVTHLAGPNGLNLKRSWELSIRSAIMPISKRIFGVVTPDSTSSLDLKAFKEFDLETLSAVMSIGAVPEFGLTTLIKDLTTYPYGCVEQTASRLLAMAYSLSAGLGECQAAPDKCTKAITADLNRLLSLQKMDGSFGLWSLVEPSHLWTTLYTADVLSTLRYRGLQVPDKLMTGLEDWLKRVQQFESNDASSISVTAYIHYLLAKQGKGTVGSLRYFADNKRKLVTERRDMAFISAAFAYYGDAVQAQKWIKKAIETKNGKAEQAQEFLGSELRDTAIMVALLAETTQNYPELMTATAELIDQAKSTHYLSTQEKAWLVRAAMAFRDLHQEYNFSLNGQDFQGSRILEHDLDAAQLKQPFKLGNKGEKPLYYTLNLEGEPISPATVTQEGFEIHRQLFTLEGKPVDSTQLKAGELYMVSIKGRRMHKGIQHIILVDLLPAGFEIENAKLSETALEQYRIWLGPITNANRIEGRDDRFMAAYELGQNDDFSAAYIVRATTTGQFTYPAVYVEGLYQPHYFRYGEVGKLIIK